MGASCPGPSWCPVYPYPCPAVTHSGLPTHLKAEPGTQTGLPVPQPAPRPCPSEQTPVLRGLLASLGDCARRWLHAGGRLGRVEAEVPVVTEAEASPLQLGSSLYICRLGAGPPMGSGRWAASLCWTASLREGQVNPFSAGLSPPALAGSSGFSPTASFPTEAIFLTLKGL